MDRLAIFSRSPLNPELGIENEEVSLHLALHDKLRDIWIHDAGHKIGGLR